MPARSSRLAATEIIAQARQRELTGNRRGGHGISRLLLQLIRDCTVCVRALMLRQVLAQRDWQGRLTGERVHPDGQFAMAMTSRHPPG